MASKPIAIWPGRARGGALLSMLLACAGPSCAVAGELYHNDAIEVRWDNTFDYTAAFRLEPRNAALVQYANADDGDRNFRPGLVSDRLDVLSELEASDGDFGLRLSASGRYDSVYQQRNDNDSPATFNPDSVPHDEFPSAVRRLEGAEVQLDDAFVHGAFDWSGTSVSFRLGRYALLWGESLFFSENGIAAGQAPSDLVREAGQSASYAKAVALPVWQASTVLQPSEDVSIAAYYQFEWRGDLLNGVGSYLSYSDFAGAGGERFIVSPGHYLYRTADLRPNAAQFGVSVQVNDSAFDYGFYALRFDAKEPQIYLRPGAPSPGDGTYQLVYPSDIEVYGASLSSYVGDSDVAGEISVRRNMPLVGRWVVVPIGALADDDRHALYALGDTLHGQVSATGVLAGNALWQRADFGVEFAFNDLLDVSRNPAALDPWRDRFAAAVQASFEPRYFEVLPALDLSLPIRFDYGLIGRSSTDETQYAGTGSLQFGIAGIYRAEWRCQIAYTQFLGAPPWQPFADRNFVSLSLQKTF